MNAIQVSDEDLAFLSAEAEKSEISVEEYLSQVIDRQRLFVKYPPVGSTKTVVIKSQVEPPHRKWGM